MLDLLCSILVVLFIVSIALAVLKAFGNNIVVKIIVWGLLIVVAIVVILDLIGLAIILGGI